MKWLQGGGEGEYSQKKTVASSPVLKHAIQLKVNKNMQGSTEIFRPEFRIHW